MLDREMLRGLLPRVFCRSWDRRAVVGGVGDWYIGEHDYTCQGGHRPELQG